MVLLPPELRGKQGIWHSTKPTLPGLADGVKHIPSRLKAAPLGSFSSRTLQREIHHLINVRNPKFIPVITTKPTAWQVIPYTK